MKRRRISLRRLGLPFYVPFPVLFFGFLLLAPVFAAAPWLVTWNSAKRPPLLPVPVTLTLPAGETTADLKRAEVLNVVDGDTIDVKVEGRFLRIRYYGVDTPERGQKCSREATDRNTTLVAKEVLLLPDARDEDHFGRPLRYVFTPEGVSIDATLVAEGFGHAWEQDGQYKGQIEDLEAQAKDAQRGCLWKAETAK